MRASRLYHKISPVPTRDVVAASSLVYTPRYSPTPKRTLSNSFDTVTEKNRFLSLEILLNKLSGYVGRRQYKMRCDLTVHLEKMKEMGIDWHELKYLGREERIELFDNVLHLNHAEKAVLLAALETKVCGVLRRSTTRHSTSLCLNPGTSDHGWRCGLHGHTNDVYFEGKQKANPAVLRIAHRSSLRMATREGIHVDVRSEPDFSVVGRFEHSLHPRVWNAPENPSFLVSTIGFEFRVHPNDPRAIKQIEEAAAEWDLHATVTQQVIWEMLEMYGVEREPQPLQLRPGEMGPPDVPQQYSSAFTTRVQPDTRSSSSSLKLSDAANDVVVEQRMISTTGEENPWFRPPHAQRYVEGVPTILPFAPSIVVRSVFRPIKRASIGDDITQQLVQPVMDISCFIHPSACFWWNPEDEERCVKHILEYAKRVPFALPFNLYFRVDSSKTARLSPELEMDKERLLKEKEDWFNLRRYRAVQQAFVPS